MAGSSFIGRILNDACMGDVATIVLEISGRAWIAAIHQYLIEADGIRRKGYRLSNTWPWIASVCGVIERTSL
jgi:proline racemase